MGADIKRFALAAGFVVSMSVLGACSNAGEPVSENMPENMSESMPENMSENMPESVSDTKTEHLKLTDVAKEIEQAPFGEIVVWDAAMADIVALDAEVIELAEGFAWSEGPVWDKAHNQLIFSDVNNNITYTWSDKDGLTPYLKPVTPLEIAAKHSSAGTNGLIIGNDGKMLAAVHGSRAVESIDIASKARTILVGEYQGKKFNSPNDLIQTSEGDIYFTDPPYGLKGQDDDPMKEIEFNGVYHLTPEGALSVIDKTLTRPNGIALSPDEQTLYVAVSDENAPMLYKYTKSANGEFGNRQLWFDESPYIAQQHLSGLPDGMVVADSGHVFAAGPGGVFVLSPEGKALGQFRTGIHATNCTLGDDGKTLYITAYDRLLRVRLKHGVSY